jgi:hypothetical protein
MEPVEYHCKDGVTRSMRIDAASTSVFGFFFQDRVLTPHGPGCVLGVHNGHLYFLLDHDTAASFWSSLRTADDFLLAGFSKAPAVTHETNSLEFHRLKRIDFLGAMCTVVMQGVNGPCPVLALSNALLLKRVWDRVGDGGSSTVSAEELRQKLQNELVIPRDEPVMFESPGERNGTRTIAGVMADKAQVERLRQRLCGGDGKEILRRFYNGLDVSPCFGSVDGFDGQDDAMLFALAGVRLFHSWYIGPDSVYGALRDKSYDEVMMLAVAVDPENADSVDLGHLSESFLDEHRNQSSIEGLQMVHRTMTNGEVAVLFLNNHFGTIVKLGEKLLRLASDESFADKPFCVFEVIWDEDGSFINDYCDGDGNLLNKTVLGVLLRQGNKHSLDDVNLALAQAVSDGNEFPTVEELERVLVPPAAVAPATPPPSSAASPAKRDARSAPVVNLLLPPVNSQRSPAAKNPLDETMKIAKTVEQLRSMGFAGDHIEGLVQAFGTADAVIDYLLSQPQ